MYSNIERPADIVQHQGRDRLGEHLADFVVEDLWRKLCQDEQKLVAASDALDLLAGGREAVRHLACLSGWHAQGVDQLLLHDVRGHRRQLFAE